MKTGWKKNIYYGKIKRAKGNGPRTRLDNKSTFIIGMKRESCRHQPGAVAGTPISSHVMTHDSVRRAGATSLRGGNWVGRLFVISWAAN